MFTSELPQEFRLEEEEENEEDEKEEEEEEIYSQASEHA